MSVFIEPLILYAVLFFRFFSGPMLPPESPPEFSASAEIARLVLQTGPSLALLWYMMLRAKGLAEWGVARPGVRDLIPALVSFAAIALVGFAVAAGFHRFGASPGVPRIIVPGAVVPWAVLTLSVFAGAYLEESFFRLYLLSRLAEMGLGQGRAVFVSTAMFALCHMHLGPWGILNAAVSGAVLACVFLRTRSLHGVGFAHGLYNVLVFALGAA